MISNKFRTTAQPSGFGMPACGHVSLAVSQVKSAWTAAPTVAAVRPSVIATDAFAGVRDQRDVAGLGFTGDLGIEPTYIPGTTAWSPPSC